ncbi:hypothetical protein D3C78_1419940 [compost metagenome]
MNGQLFVDLVAHGLQRSAIFNFELIGVAVLLDGQRTARHRCSRTADDRGTGHFRAGRQIVDHNVVAACHRRVASRHLDH